MLRCAFRYNDTRLFSRLVQWWFSTDTAHCEVIVSDDLCLSSSFVDKGENGHRGVRLKNIKLSEDKWRIYEIDAPHINPLLWYEEHKTYKYDFLAIFGFLYRPLKDGKKACTCSEVMAEVLLLENAHAYAPHHLEQYLKKVGKRIQ